MTRTTTAARPPARLTVLLTGLAVLAMTMAGLPPISAHADAVGTVMIGAVEDVVSTELSSQRESDACSFDGVRVVDSTTQGVRIMVYVRQPSVGEVWLCGRVQATSTGDGYGGRLELNIDVVPHDDPGQLVERYVDGDASACSTALGNQAPGDRPLSQGGVGPVNYLIDAFVNENRAWLCLRVDSASIRVRVPLGGMVGATWYPDEGTPGF